MGAAGREREAISNLLERLGPHAPTLCAGWDTSHLAAHLVARDTRPDAVPGMVIELSGLTGHTERVQDALRRSVSYDELIERIRHPPRLSLFSFPPTRELLNVHEYFIHHEDVRRANGEGPRRLDADLVSALRWRLELSAPWLLRRLGGMRLVLELPDGTVIAGAGTGVELHVRGEIGELFVFAYNRRSAARVRLSGSRIAREMLQATRLGP